MDKECGVLIIGAGASGLTAAISAARRGEDVKLVERGASAGRKILICGAGRCNLFNDSLDESFYNKEAARHVKAVFSRFGKNEIVSFFSGLGLSTYSQDGRVFPSTNQSSSVLRVLLIELERLGVKPVYGCGIIGIERSAGCFSAVTAGGERISCRKIILACGGKSYPATGSDGGGYLLARRLGHELISPVPAAVPLLVKENICHLSQGQRIYAEVKGISGGRVVCRAAGDLLFTKYGVSGTAVLDVSSRLSVGLHRFGDNDVYIEIDMVPFMGGESLREEIARRIDSGFKRADLLSGILPEKLCRVILGREDARGADELAASLKKRRFRVNGTKGWDEAEFTAGGVALSDVDSSTLESKKCPGLFFCGEILDVDGIRGGYNLAWAWASGFVAGFTGGHERKHS